MSGKEKTEKNQAEGGIGFMIRTDISNMVEEIDGPSELTETKWIKLKTKNPIYIVVTYGHQENTPIDKVENQYHELTTDTIRHQQNNDVIIIGNLNSKMKILKNTCQQQTSRNGKLL